QRGPRGRKPSPSAGPRAALHEAVPPHGRCPPHRVSRSGCPRRPCFRRYNGGRLAPRRLTQGTLLAEAALMTVPSDPLDRIAAALERLAPPAAPATDWSSHPAYLWTGQGARPIDRIDAPRPDLLRGVDRQKLAVNENVSRLAAGHAAHDMLLWGARGMGKSALVRSAVMAAQAQDPARIALVQTGTDTP